MSSQNDYDKDCNIIKETVTKEEFKKEIELLKEENKKLQKEIELLRNKNTDDNSIIKPIKLNFNKDDKIIEDKCKDLLVYLNSLLCSQNFINNRYIEIDKNNEVLVDKFNSVLVQYLKRRNLCFKVRLQHCDTNLIDKNKYYLAEYNFLNDSHVNFYQYYTL